MGIPAFFRWITVKYPKLTTQAEEENNTDINNVKIPVDATKPNPNGVEFDNLYLDMNGIIHPCTHPEDKPAPKNEDEMYKEIFLYIDRIFDIIRPRNLVYMAIDGVAPRAKMNQQRSRRFRAAQEAQILIEEQEKIRKDLMERNIVGEGEEKKEHFDSNCITPGTPFMTRLAIALRYYIAEKLNSNTAWSNIKVILSDASVPGEGEHKIMDYIRRTRNQPEYNPNTSHVLYGLDADLIMLAIATHEPHFYILREDVMFKNAGNTGCFICGQPGHLAAACKGTPVDQTKTKTVLPAKPYIIFHVAILREYLEMELAFNHPAVQWDLERALDDWVMLCFFVGNDFLPHLPSLDIKEGAIDKLVELWKKHVIEQQGYLTNSGDIDLKKVKGLMMDLGVLEDQIFIERRKGDERRREARRRRRAEAKKSEEMKNLPKVHPSEVFDLIPSYPVNMSAQQRQETNLKAISDKRSGVEWTPDDVRNKNAALLLKESFKKNISSTTSVNLAKSEITEQVIGVKRTIENVKLEDRTDLVEEAAESVEKEETEDAEKIEEEEDEEEIEEIESGIVDPILALNIPEEVKKVVSKKMAQKDIMENDSEEEPEDNVKLWESGWKQRYYNDKFQTEADNEEFKRKIVTAYVEGFCWVLKYYYQGVQSWTWYFPFHYSPFASDFDFIDELTITFDLGKPFNPYEQLMGVLPALSRKHVPEPFQDLMLNENSPIIDFYPEKFPIDLNGKKYAWQGVALLPFIDEKRLVEEMKPYYSQLTAEQQKECMIGSEYLWLGKQHEDFEEICSFYGKKQMLKDEDNICKLPGTDVLGSCKLDAEVCLPASTFYSPLEDFSDIFDNCSISVIYLMPSYEPGFLFPSKTLSQVKFPRKMLDSVDYEFVRSGGGSVRGNRGRGGRGGRGDSRGINGASGRFIRHGIGADNDAEYYERQLDTPAYFNNHPQQQGGRHLPHHRDKKGRYEESHISHSQQFTSYRGSYRGNTRSQRGGSSSYNHANSHNTQYQYRSEQTFQYQQRPAHTTRQPHHHTPRVGDFQYQPDQRYQQRPAFQPSQYQQPAYQQTSYQQPIYQQPPQFQPHHQRPPYQRPQYQQPPNQQQFSPSYQQPRGGYNQRQNVHPNINHRYNAYPPRGRGRGNYNSRENSSHNGQISGGFVPRD
ncbi:5'-3' exoribonuclease 2, partial [Clydaea vesicula]